MYAKRNVLLTVIALLVCFMAGFKTAEYFYLSAANTSLNVNTQSQNSNFENPRAKDLSLYWDVWEELETRYVNGSDVLDTQKFIYGSIKGLTASLGDPYTVFMTPEETKEFEENLNSQLQGIGTELTVEDGLLIVLSPLKDSPAEKAGLKPGDIIFEIDGNPTTEMTLFEAIMNIRGEKGTQVTLTIIRKELAEPLYVTITRDDINIESVTFERLEGNIAYISINQFSDDTAEEFEKAVNDILLSTPKGIILDLRYNGGGYLDIAVDIVSEFIEGKKSAVEIKTRIEKDNEVFTTSGNARIQKIPLIVLVNYGSASASEIVAGAIQDLKRGLVMGEQTYGKGSVQEVEFLRDGSSLRLTIAKWLTPSGRDIDEVGITPDRIIEQKEEDYENGIDTQLEEARSYLENL
ncbi:S41 family peptidase [Candidatus Peregrinibacteria bacterium]|nr:S41 family peptidase [Candidatus Peregrinibacteria bacterium]